MIVCFLRGDYVVLSIRLSIYSKLYYQQLQSTSP